MAVAGNGAGDHPTNGVTLRTVPAVPIAFAALGVLGLIDLLGGRDVVLSDLFTVGPCLAAVSGAPAGAACEDRRRAAPALADSSSSHPAMTASA